VTPWLEQLSEELHTLRQQHQWRHRRLVQNETPPYLQIDGQRLLAFCSNDYLGLSHHPAVIEALREGARLSGAGAGASPLVSGHHESHEQLERELAEFVGLERALYFYAGYGANVGIIPALVGSEDVIFSDALNHACLIDGARLSRAVIHRFPHRDYATLEQQLALAFEQSPSQHRLVMSDAVFSMDGDVAELPRLLALCEQFDALLLLDDAHGFGVRGPQGRGSLAAVAKAVQPDRKGTKAHPRLLYMATLGKAAGVAGAFVAGSDLLIEYLLQKTRSYLFATAPPPPLAYALRASLSVLGSSEGEERRAHLATLMAYCQTQLRSLIEPHHGQLLPSSTPIQAWVIGSNEKALDWMNQLAKQGIWIPAIRPPTVPIGQARLRIALSACHTLDHLEQLGRAINSKQ
jgi:8-amino-7-oxononanoate synthase